MKLPFRFRFSLQTLFILVAAVAIVASWLGHQLNWMRARQKVADTHHVVTNRLLGDKITYLAPRPKAPWPLSFLGENGYVAVDVEPSESADELDRISKLFPEAEVSRQPEYK